MLIKKEKPNICGTGGERVKFFAFFLPITLLDERNMANIVVDYSFQPLNY